MGWLFDEVREYIEEVEEGRRDHLVPNERRTGIEGGMRARWYVVGVIDARGAHQKSGDMIKTQEGGWKTNWEDPPRHTLGGGGLGLC